MIPQPTETKSRKEGKQWNYEMRALPEDLVTEILLKLPVKSLLRFRCICRSWNHLIRSSDFIKKHLKHHSTKKDYILITKSPLWNYSLIEFRGSLQNLQIPLLSLQSYDSLSLISPDLRIPHDVSSHFTLELYGPCNGIICISINRQDIMVCNPFLREFKLIQPRPFASRSGIWSDVAIGFWFDSCTEGYKVVRIVNELQLDMTYTVEVELYEHSNHSWRQIKNHILEEETGPFMYLRNGTNWNDMIHWVKCDTEILSFDITTEVFQSMRLPSDPKKQGKLMQVTVLNECLAVFSYTDSSHINQSIDLWKMEDYGVEECWTKLFTIAPVNAVLVPLFLWKDDTMILEGHELPWDYNRPPKRLFTCSVATLELKELQIERRPCTFKVMNCNDSLVSIDV